MSLPSKPSLLGQPLLLLQYIVYGSAILYLARSVLVPLSFAVLISFMIYPVCVWLERKGSSRIRAIVICVSAITLVIVGIALLLVQQVVRFSKEWPQTKAGLTELVEGFSETMATQLGVSREVQGEWITKAVDSFFSDGFSLLSNAISVSATSAVLALLIPVYVVLILYYRKLWVYGLAKLVPGSSPAGIRQILSYSIQAYYNFVKGMLIVYLVVGTLNSIGLYFLDVPHPVLFGVMASVLTFIPYVGILFGSLLPITFAWAAHHSIWYPLGVVGVFAFVQYLEANIIFPFAVSNRLQVNTMVGLLAIFLGGLLWGVAGMILFIPFVGILKLIADHDPTLRTWALVLGTDPHVEEETLSSILRKSDEHL